MNTIDTMQMTMQMPLPLAIPIPIQTSLPLPLPAREDLSIRAAVMGDLAFIDGLQKQHTKQVGWLPTKTLEGKIARGEVLVAWASCLCSGTQDMGETPMPHGENMGETPSLPEPLGYLIGADRYFKREDVGIIYQVNVVPGKQRAFVGAALVKAMFERAAYGCRLFCCWCAQDIAANRFWEAMGFVPLAFRAGSEAKSRVHIFWQKRIVAGDVTTPYWFPSQTGGGSLREDRLVLPIPPGTHWSDAKPIVLPMEKLPVASCQLPGKREKTAGGLLLGREPKFVRPMLGAPLWFAAPAPAKQAKGGKAKEPRKRRKNDPKLVAAARELRDRWLEQVNAEPSRAMACEKYEVSRVRQARPPAAAGLLAA